MTDPDQGDSPADAGEAAQADQPEVVQGRLPTLEELRWRAASAEITPAKSLDRIEAKATFVFTSVALIGTIITGFGLMSGVSSRLTQYRPWAEALYGLLGGALACALIATLPSLRSRMRTLDVKTVRRYYTVSIRVRGWLTRIALLAFSFAFAIALSLLFVTNGQESPTLELQWTLGASNSRVLSGQFSEENLPPGASADARLVAIAADGEQVLLAEAVSTVGETGKLQVDMVVPNAPAAGLYRLSVSLTNHGAIVSPPQSVDLKA